MSSDLPLPRTDAEAVPAPEAPEGRLRLVPPSPGASLPTTPAELDSSVDAQVPPDLSAASLYLNRELTLLNFYFRVVNEAEDPRNPLLERIRFAAIVGSNIDDFVMKRIGGLKQQLGAGVSERTVDGRTPEEQIHQCFALIRLLDARLRTIVRDLEALLLEKGIRFLRPSQLPEERRKALRRYYLTHIHPLVTPQATDPAHPFPFISNLSLNLVLSLRDPSNEEVSLARVKVPVGAGTPRFLRLEGTLDFVPIEQVLIDNLDVLFPGMSVDSCSIFRVTRNANTEREEESAEDLMELIESELRDRKFAPVVRLQVSRSIEPAHLRLLTHELGLRPSEVFEIGGLQGLRDLMEIADLDLPDLREPAHHPTDHPALKPDRSIFKSIREAGPILLQHPYQSYATSVERFLSEASRDPEVRAIKMTLYRTSEDSKAVDHLIEAARNGKQVAVAVEIKASFDEAANIRWANRLEEVGIHVTYGVVGLKTHCKVILVVRQDPDGIRRYAHIGTGNYHAGTARRYTDFGLLTASRRIGQDLTELFNYLTTGFKPKRRFRRLLPAPKILKAALLEKIDREIDVHGAGRPAGIQMKMNALEDPDIVRALYRASMAGVPIDLIVRDTCRLRPHVPGLSETIRVVSIIGRFLEHGRVYWFRNGGDEEYYIGSADCMTRNLQGRVEVLAPVEDADLRAQLRFVLDTQLADRRGGWEMQSDGSYVLRAPMEDLEAKSSQALMIERVSSQRREASRLRHRRSQPLGRRNRR
ncbi:MAG: polyphosphate kinase 1 [Gemmatimonadota bacterium]|nr:polyphosphate kinase 1 [Gemmatimonadota bacterium]